MITTNYIQKFIQLNVVKYVPDGIHPLYHINTRKEVYSLVIRMVLNKPNEVKLSYIKMLIVDYKEILNAKFSTLN